MLFPQNRSYFYGHRRNDAAGKSLVNAKQSVLHEFFSVQSVDLDKQPIRVDKPVFTHTVPGVEFELKISVAPRG